MLVEPSLYLPMMSGVEGSTCVCRRVLAQVPCYKQSTDVADARTQERHAVKRRFGVLGHDA